MSDVSFLDGADARKGRWRDAAAEAKGVYTKFFWTGRGRDALEVAYGTAASKPNVTTVREVWKRRHGRAAAPLLVVVAYQNDEAQRAVVCGPAGEGASSAECSTADREVYANDPDVLLSTDAGTNRTKGDKGPEAWRPPNRDYWCEYARRWIWIKSDWRLSVNHAEKSSLREMLGTCGTS